MRHVNYSAVAGGRTSSFLNTETGFKSPLAPASHLYFSMKNNTKQALHRNKKCYAPLNQPQKLQYCSKRQHHIIPKLWIRVQIPAPSSFESSLFFIMKNRLYLTKYQSLRRKKIKYCFFQSTHFSSLLLLNVPNIGQYIIHL